jgi:hypothetical protein
MGYGSLSVKSESCCKFHLARLSGYDNGSTVVDEAM